MFEFSRELRRLLQPHTVFAPARDGLCGGEVVDGARPGLSDEDVAWLGLVEGVFDQVDGFGQ